MPGWSAEDWIKANAPKVREALKQPEVAQALYALLGGEPDPSEQHKRLEKRLERLPWIRRMRQ
jgi:hypothetical protein